MVYSVQAARTRPGRHVQGSEGFLDFLRLNVLDLLKISTFSVSGFLSPKASSSPYLPQRKYSSPYTRKSKKHHFEKIQVGRVSQESSDSDDMSEDT